MALPVFEKLPDIVPQFHVARLADNHLNKIAPTGNAGILADNAGEQCPRNIIGIRYSDIHWTTSDDLWLNNTLVLRKSHSQIKSWDTLCSSPSSSACSSKSETGAMGYHLEPISHSVFDIIHPSHPVLLASVKKTVLGLSSALHTWDDKSESFVATNGVGNMHEISLVDGKAGQLVTSYLCRFLTIGTLWRRLSSLVRSLRSRTAYNGPTLHAFAHALSTILTFLRDKLVHLQSNSEVTEAASLISLWMHCDQVEETLISIAHICGCEQRKHPAQYDQLDSSPQSLLSQIYVHLDVHIEKASPSVIIAIFAYLLTVVSEDYFRQVGASIGIGSDTRPSPSEPVVNSGHARHSFDGEQDFRADDLLEVPDESFPDFISTEYASALTTAKRSLSLLRAANPAHPLLKENINKDSICWVWSELEVRRLQTQETQSPLKEPESENPALGSSSAPLITKYKAGLARFEVFDLEPGSHFTSSTLANEFFDSSTSKLREFVINFPQTLPSIAPTLTRLTSFVLAPLIRHAETLSRTLLSEFLDASSPLYLHHHLLLLRSYLLLSSNTFKSRLSATLFCDADQSSISRPSSLQNNIPAVRQDLTKPWAVGLAAALTDRGSWPPGGAELGFILRTVIVDSLEGDYGTRRRHEGLMSSVRMRIVEEAEFRLGFAIRDLPVGPGRDKWLNPLLIEALDFLYMDYKPPQPLQVFVTPEILSKYQRMFAFLLRLMRVKSAVNALFRMSRKPPFAVTTASNTLFFHFRFVAHSFVMSFSQYVFETAIGGNYDRFLSQLILSEYSAFPESTAGFSNVFALTELHSKVLDDILTACLSRSGQKYSGDLLRGALELVLDLCVLMGELHRDRIAENHAASTLEDLFQRFRKKMGLLTTRLKASADSNQSEIEFGNLLRGVTGSAACLHELVLRLEIGDWWSTAD